MPVELSDSSTTMRPSPFVPRRKSTSRSACWTSPGWVSAKRCTVCALASSPPLWSNSVTWTTLPSTWVSKVCGLSRFSTTRVRLPTWTTLTLRSAGSAISWLVRPRPLAVSRKSSATRAGFATANPAGGLAGGAFSVKRTTVRPDAPLETLSESIELVVCAPVGPAAASASATSSHAAAPMARARVAALSIQTNALIFFAPVSSSRPGSTAACWNARSNPPRCPVPAPSSGSRCR